MPTYSLFMQNLTWAILNSLWQATLLWVIVYLLRKQDLPKRLTYFAGLTAEFIVFALFLSALFSPSALVPMPASLSLPLSITETKVFSLEIINILTYLLSSVYIILLLFKTGWGCFKWYHSKKIHPLQEKEAFPEWVSFIREKAGLLGIQRPIKLLIHNGLYGPWTKGIWKPVIYIPLAVVNHLTPKQVEAILLHELAHIKYWDYGFNLMQALIENLLYFNPFIKEIGNGIREDREITCDRLVLKQSYSASHFAHSLLALAQLQIHIQKSLNLYASGSHKEELLHRVRYMLTGKTQETLSPRTGIMAVLMMAFFALPLLTVLPKTKPGEASQAPFMANNRPLSPEKEVVLSMPLQPQQTKKAVDRSPAITARAQNRKSRTIITKPLQSTDNHIDNIEEKGMAENAQPTTIPLSHPEGDAQLNPNSLAVNKQKSNTAPFSVIPAVNSTTAPFLKNWQIEKLGETNKTGIYLIRSLSGQSIDEKQVYAFVTLLAQQTGELQEFQNIRYSSYTGSQEADDENTIYLKSSTYTILLQKREKYIKLAIQYHQVNAGQSGTPNS